MKNLCYLVIILLFTVCLTCCGGGSSGGGGADSGDIMDDGGGSLPPPEPPPPPQDDNFEPNDSSNNAAVISENTYTSLRCNDDDWFRIYVSSGQNLSITINFAHSSGDLDIRLYNSSLSLVTAGTSSSSNETVATDNTTAGYYYVKVYGFQGATNIYSMTITIEDPANLDGGTITVNNYSGDSGVAVIGITGSVILQSSQLREDLEVKIIDGDTGQVVPNITVEWVAHNGKIAVIVYDPAGFYASAIFVGDPSQGSSPQGKQNFQQKPFFVTGALLIMTIVAITVAEISYITDAYEMAEFQITNIADIADEYGVFRTTIDELTSYLKSQFNRKIALFNIATSLVMAPSPSVNSGWAIYTTALNMAGSQLRDDLINYMYGQHLENIFGGLGESTEIYVKIYNWQANNQLFDFSDIIVEIYPINWDDNFEQNDSFIAARNVTTENESGLIVYENDPDYFSFYLNPGNSFEAKVSFLNRSGDVNLYLYNPQKQLIDSSTTNTNEETVRIDSVSTAGCYYLKVTNSGGEWSSNIYNLWVSNVGGENLENRDSYRFVLEWGEHPRDLDSHLLTPPIAGDAYHIYYPASNRGSTTGLPFAELDVDDISSFGPETITIGRLFPGTYRYSIFNYSRNPAITTSQAMVTVFDEFGLLEEFSIPTSGAGLWWHLFEINGETGQLTVINQISSDAIGE
ncbi:pre-peptidase C-terminal domain-containing protein [Planctomycetota bacterium]